MDAINETLGIDDEQTNSVSDAAFSSISFILRTIVNPAASLVGIITNGINMAVFYKMGLFDGVTQNFFILSISDGLYAIACFVNNTASIIWRIVRGHPGYRELETDIQAIYQASLYAFAIPYNVSVIITTVIAVVRCCCVAMPLKVRYLFTARRQLAAILLFSVIMTSISVANRSSLYPVVVTHPVTNITLFYFNMPQWSVETASNNTLLCTGFIICVVCVVILSSSLRKASRFRDSSTGGASSNASALSTSALEAKSKDRMRNAKVVRIVVLVSTFFIAFNVPAIIYFTMKVFVPGLGPNGKYRQLNDLIIAVAIMFVLLNVIINTFIYISFNTRYRNILFTMCGKIKNTNES